MKLKNSTDWTDHFLRRMVAWCCKQIGMPVRVVWQAQFRNRHMGYAGRACYDSHRIVCSIGLAGFPMSPDDRPGMQNEAIADRIEALVALTAHELYHLAARYVPAHRQKTRRHERFASSEQATRHEEVRVLRLFRAERDALIAQWSVEPEKRERPKLSIQEKRTAKAQAALDRWQRKAKLAATKVKQYKRQVAYYDKALAAKRAK